MALEVSCSTLGLACSKTVRADNPEDLARRVAEHARRDHDVELTQTLEDYALSRARQVAR